MDTSKEYIKMCEKAGEIQKLWQPSTGDYFWYWGNPEHGMGADRILTEDEIEDEVIILGDDVWLPRQDQLQEMITTEKTIEATSALIGQLYGFFLYHEAMKGRFTFEQVWLSFVMEVKYNKKWDGAEWK